jgi:hypothetical protein
MVRPLVRRLQCYCLSARPKHRRLSARIWIIGWTLSSQVCYFSPVVPSWLHTANCKSYRALEGSGEVSHADFSNCGSDAAVKRFDHVPHNVGEVICSHGRLRLHEHCLFDFGNLCTFWTTTLVECWRTRQSASAWLLLGLDSQVW